MDVVILYDMIAPNERRALEIRGIACLGNTYYCSPDKTVYSISYDSQIGRTYAIWRAFTFCEENGLVLLTCEIAEDCHSVWQ